MDFSALQDFHNDINPPFQNQVLFNCNRRNAAQLEEVYYVQSYLQLRLLLAPLFLGLGFGLFPNTLISLSLNIPSSEAQIVSVPLFLVSAFPC